MVRSMMLQGFEPGGNVRTEDATSTPKQASQMQHAKGEVQSTANDKSCWRVNVEALCTTLVQGVR